MIKRSGIQNEDTHGLGNHKTVLCLKHVTHAHTHTHTIDLLQSQKLNTLFL